MKKGVFTFTLIVWLRLPPYIIPHCKLCTVITKLHKLMMHLSHCPDGPRVTSGWARLTIWGLLQGETWAGHPPPPPRGGAWLFHVFPLCSEALHNGAHAVFMSVKKSQAPSLGTRMRDDSFVGSLKEMNFKAGGCCAVTKKGHCQLCCSYISS